ncbi:MAG: serine/threonine-protein kinase [Planctomycetota bacterium]
MTDPICNQCGTPLRGVAAGLCPRCLLDRGAETRPLRPGPIHRPEPIEMSELEKLFPDLEFDRAVGHGGMGIVYRARQRRLDRWIALKILPDAATGDPEFVERFEREARAMARLDHGNIVTVFDFGEAGDHCYLTMEFVDGPTLRDVIDTGPLATHEALKIVPQVCDALEYAHSQGIVHRDIKPENILLTREGSVRMVDFGLAKLLEAGDDYRGLTQSRHVMGTPSYMAPEQVERPLEVDHRADIYSLGVVLYELLTGELPLGRFSPPSEKVQVDDRLDHVVFRALDKEPAARYQHASEVKTDLDAMDHPAGRRCGPRRRRQKAPQYAEARAGRGAAWGYAANALGWVVFMLVITVPTALGTAGLVWWLRHEDAKSDIAVESTDTPSAGEAADVRSRSDRGTVGTSENPTATHHEAGESSASSEPDPTSPGETTAEPEG